MAIRIPKYYLRFAILALLAGFSIMANAENYYWYGGGNSAIYPHFGNATSACDWLAKSGLVGVFASGIVEQYNIPNAQCRLIRSDNTWINSQTVSRVGGTCPFTATYNASIGSCTCPAGEFYTGAGVCNAVPSCPVGKVANAVTGECEWMTSCPAGQSMLKQTSAGGTIVAQSCVPNVLPDPQGACITYEQNQSAACKTKQAECTSTGGTFGVVGTNNVCIPAGSGPPPCASGASQFTANADGSNSPTCVGTPNVAGSNNNNIGGAPVSSGTATSATTVAQSGADTANNTAAIAKINNAGFQAIVNAINNGTSKSGGGAAGGSTAAQDQGNTAGIVSAINANTASEKGAGQCDPHATNYATCIGQAGPNPDHAAKLSSVGSSGDSQIAAAGDSLVSALGTQTEIEDGSGSIGSKIIGSFSGASSCSDYTMSFPRVHVTMSCSNTEVSRAWLGFALVLLTMYGCFNAAFAKD